MASLDVSIFAQSLSSLSHELPSAPAAEADTASALLLEARAAPSEAAAALADAVEPRVGGMSV